MKGRDLGKEAGAIKIRDVHEFKVLMIYALSLFLALVLIIASVTILITVIYVFGHIRPYDFFLFASILGANVILSLFSLRGILTSYSSINSSMENRNVVVVSAETHSPPGEKPMSKEKLTTEFFTETELNIIDLLLKNNNHLLQSSLVGTVGASKASISRALTSLESKGILVKVRKGVTNEIIMPETYFK